MVKNLSSSMTFCYTMSYNLLFTWKRHATKINKIPLPSMYFLTIYCEIMPPTLEGTAISRGFCVLQLLFDSDDEINIYKLDFRYRNGCATYHLMVFWFHHLEPSSDIQGMINWFLILEHYLYWILHGPGSVIRLSPV